jgi:hypothetical protein
VSLFTYMLWTITTSDTSFCLSINLCSHSFIMLTYLRSLKMTYFVPSSPSWRLLIHCTLVLTYEFQRFHVIYHQLRFQIYFKKKKLKAVFMGTLVSSTNKTDCRDITEILLKVVLNTITQTWKEGFPFNVIQIKILFWEENYLKVYKPEL